VGQEIDSVILAIELFAAAAIFLIPSYYAISALNDMGIFPVEVMTSIISLFGAFDYIIASAFVIYFIISIILAYFLPSSPAFFITLFFNAIFALVIVPQISNAYAMIGTNTVLETAFNSFPLTNYVIGTLPLLAFILTLVVAIITYGKNYGRQTTTL